jgi:hypothetical protein
MVKAITTCCICPAGFHIQKFMLQDEGKIVEIVLEQLSRYC